LPKFPIIYLVVSGYIILDISTIPLENLVNKMIKFLSGEKPSLINIGLKSSLQPGKILQGEIIKILPKKKVAISFAGQKLVAELPEVSLKNAGNSFITKEKNLFKPGNKIYAKVEKINPSPILKLIPPPAQQNQEEGYTTKFSREIRTEFKKFEKISESKLLPDEINSVKTTLKGNKNSLPVITKPEASFKIGTDANGKNEKIKPWPISNLTPSSEKKNQANRFIRKIPIRLTLGNLDLSGLKKLKLLADKIIPIKIIRAININILSVQFEDQKFFVKSENANLYKPGEQVRIKIQKIGDGYRPVLLDSPNNLIKNIKDINTANSDYPVKQERLTSATQLKSQMMDSDNSSVLQGSSVNTKIINLNLIKPYLQKRIPFGKIIGELKREIIESAVLKNIPIKQELLERIRKSIEVLAPKPNTLPNESYIKDQIDISGIGYEAKVKQLLLHPENSKNKMEVSKDLKGQLLELNQSLDKSIRNNYKQNPIRQLAEIQQKIKVSVDNIELNQLSTRFSNQENQPLVLQIPNPICPSEKSINLFIRKDSHDNKSGEDSDKEFYSLAFYLELSSLGNIKMNIKVGANSMEVRMDVDREDVAKFVRNNASEFEQKMKKSGLDTTVECFKEEQVLPIKDNLIELLVSKNTSLLNIKT